MAEILVWCVAGIVAGALRVPIVNGSHALVRWAVPILTGQRVLIAPLRDTRVLVPTWPGMHRLTDGTPVIGEVLATLIGVTLFGVAVFAVLFAIVG